MCDFAKEGIATRLQSTGFSYWRGRRAHGSERLARRVQVEGSKNNNNMRARFSLIPLGTSGSVWQMTSSSLSGLILRLAGMLHAGTLQSLAGLILRPQMSLSGQRQDPIQRAHASGAYKFTDPHEHILKNLCEKQQQLWLYGKTAAFHVFNDETVNSCAGHGFPHGVGSLVGPLA